MKTTAVRCLWVLILLSCTFSIEGINFGVKAGPQLSNHDESFNGSKAGIFTSFPLSRRLSLQPEVFYSQRRIEYAGESFESEATQWYSDTVKYIEVPVLIKYTFNHKGRLRPVFFGGGYSAFRLSKNPDSTRALESYGNPMEATKRTYNNIESGIILGIGLEHGRGRTRIMIDLRFNYGLTSSRKFYGQQDNISWNSNQEYYTNSNRSLSLLVGLGF